MYNIKVVSFTCYFHLNMPYILMFTVKIEVRLYIFQLKSITENINVTKCNATKECHLLEFYTKETKSFQIFHLYY